LRFSGYPAMALILVCLSRAWSFKRPGVLLCRPSCLVGHDRHELAGLLMTLFFLFSLLLFACSSLALFPSQFQWPYLYLAHIGAL
jgi:hypothetical protein